MSIRQVPSQESGPLTWLTRRVHSLICGMSGHDLLLHVEPGRLSLQCVLCPYETPGWTIKESRQQAGDARPAVFIEQRAQ
jgi:hypothetical protein